MPKIEFVSQAELAAVLASYNALGQIILGIRRRIEAGAAVEEGIYTADSNRGDPISGFDRAMNGIGLFGLDLETKGLPSDVYAEPVAVREEVERATAEQKPPDWLETGTDGYELSWWPDGQNACGPLQSIELTRAEFIALKHKLAELRGYAVPEAASA